MIFIHGTLTSIGVIERSTPQECEIEIQTGDGESRIRGLTLEQAQELGPMLYQPVTITIECKTR